MTNQPVINALKALLADNYALYLKTQNFHWNVQCHDFASLHSMFEDQYTDLSTAVDDTAELIRGLQEKVPARIAYYLFYGYGGSTGFNSEANDGHSAIKSMLFDKVEKTAVRVFGYEEDHMSILKNNKVIGDFTQLLGKY